MGNPFFLLFLNTDQNAPLQVIPNYGAKELKFVIYFNVLLIFSQFYLELVILGAIEHNILCFLFVQYHCFLFCPSIDGLRFSCDFRLSFFWVGMSDGHHVKQLVSVRSRVCCRKAILALLDQLTSFGQRESLTIHASSGSGRMSAVSSAQSVKMLQSVAARWRCSKWFGN